MLAPPKPLLGTATYRRESNDDVSWTGDLRAKLPGFGVVPLTGDGFELAVCADSGCRHGIYAGACSKHTNCTKTLPKPLSELIEFDSSGYFSSGVATTEVQPVR